MELIKVNKTRYRKHLNIVIAGCIITLAFGSLGIAQILIALFPDADGSHFHWNLTGVVISAISIGVVLNKLRHHPLMTEVTYIWDLKQILNKLTRKMAKLKAAAQDGDIKAMHAIQYSYSGSRLLWELDDNTIVMDELAIAQAELDNLATKYQVSPSAEKFRIEDLQNY